MSRYGNVGRWRPSWYLGRYCQTLPMEKKRMKTEGGRQRCQALRPVRMPGSRGSQQGDIVRGVGLVSRRAERAGTGHRWREVSAPRRIFTQSITVILCQRLLSMKYGCECRLRDISGRYQSTRGVRPLSSRLLLPCESAQRTDVPRPFLSVLQPCRRSQETLPPCHRPQQRAPPQRQYSPQHHQQRA